MMRLFVRMSLVDGVAPDRLRLHSYSYAIYIIHIRRRCCSMWQCVAACCRLMRLFVRMALIDGMALDLWRSHSLSLTSVLQYVAVCCSVLQRVAA